MGFTIEDMVTTSKDKYGMRLLAGENGWSNSISWILMIEDMVILQNFKGKDLAVTTGLGFQTPEKQLELVEQLSSLGGSGLVVNTGMYITEIPEEVRRFCDENDFPLLTVPWHIELFDLIKDLNMRVLLQGLTDEQISAALIRAIEDPGAVSQYRNDLLPYFDVDGTFQVVLLDTGDLDVMDTVDRRRISYQLQIYLESITHNASFFYYDACFVMVVNDISREYVNQVLTNFLNRARRKMQGKNLVVGVGSILKDISSLHDGYRRAKAAVHAAFRTGQSIVWFDEMGLYRLLTLVPDETLKEEMGSGLLAPLLDYDKKHQTDYVKLLESYLQNNGSIQAVSEEMYAHRNTVIYRMNNIRKLLGCELETADDRMKYQIACMLLHAR